MSNTLTSRTIRGGALTLGATVVSRLLGVAGMIFLVRTLTPEDFGLFTMALAGISSFELLSGLGTGHAVVQSRANPKDLGVAGLSISSVVGLLMFALLVQFADYFALFFGDKQVSTIVVYLAPLVLARSVTIVPAAFLQKNMWFGRRAVVTVTGELLNTVVSVLAAASGLGFWSLVYGSIARAFTLLFLSWVLSNPKDWFRFAVPQWSMVKSILSFGSQSTVFGLLTFVTHTWHNLLLGRVLGATAVGYYSRAFAFATMPLERGVQALAGALFPVYSKLQSSPERLKDGYLRSTQVLSLITLPVLLGMCAISEDFVYVVLGDAWAPMITILQVLAIMSFFKFFAMATSPLYFATGFPRYNVGVAAIEASSTILFTLIAVPYGIVWVACASALAHALGAAYGLKTVNKVLPGVLPGLFRAVKPSFVGCVVMMVGIWAARPTVQALFSTPHSWAVLVSLVVMGAGLYLGSVVLVDRSVIGVALDVWRHSISRGKPQLAVAVSGQPRNP